MNINLRNIRTFGEGGSSKVLYAEGGTKTKKPAKKQQKSIKSSTLTPTTARPQAYNVPNYTFGVDQAGRNYADQILASNQKAAQTFTEGVKQAASRTAQTHKDRENTINSALAYAKRRGIPYDPETIMAMQKELGVEADGKWGNKSETAYRKANTDVRNRANNAARNAKTINGIKMSEVMGNDIKDNSQVQQLIAQFPGRQQIETEI